MAALVIPPSTAMKKGRGGGVLTIYMEKKRKFLVENQMVPPFRMERFRKHGYDFRQYNFFTLLSLFSWFWHDFSAGCFPPRQSLQFYIYAQDFNPSGFA